MFWEQGDRETLSQLMPEPDFQELCTLGEWVESEANLQFQVLLIMSVVLSDRQSTRAESSSQILPVQILLCRRNRCDTPPSESCSHFHWPQGFNSVCVLVFCCGSDCRPPEPSRRDAGGHAVRPQAIRERELCATGCHVGAFGTVHLFLS